MWGGVDEQGLGGDLEDPRLDCHVNFLSCALLNLMLTSFFSSPFFSVFFYLIFVRRGAEMGGGGI